MCEGDHVWLEKHLDKRVSNLGDKVKDGMTYKKKRTREKMQRRSEELDRKGHDFNSY